MKENEIVKKYGKEETKKFLKWMNGQTIGINKDGTFDYYEEDVLRFMNGKGDLTWD